MLAPVSFAWTTLDERGRLQPVEEAGNVALGDIKALGELLLADAFRLAQGGQHVALRDRDSNLAQPLADRRLHAGFQANQAEPDSNRAFGGVPIRHARLPRKCLVGRVDFRLSRLQNGVLGAKVLT